MSDTTVEYHISEVHTATETQTVIAIALEEERARAWIETRIQDKGLQPKWLDHQVCAGYRTANDANWRTMYAYISVERIGGQS